MNAIGKVAVDVSARALFDFEEENRVFREDDPAAYCAIQAARLGVMAGPGPRFRSCASCLHSTRTARMTSRSRFCRATISGVHVGTA